MPRYIVSVNGQEYDITLSKRGESINAEVNGVSRLVVVHQLADTRSLILVDNNSLEVDVRSNGGCEKNVFMRGKEIPVIIEDYSLAQMRKTAGVPTGGAAQRSFIAPMPGMVVDTCVKVGDKVNSGQPLVIIEAMKMENVLKAKGDGVVSKLYIVKGQSVEKGTKLVEFE